MNICVFSPTPGCVRCCIRLWRVCKYRADSSAGEAGSAPGGGWAARKPAEASSEYQPRRPPLTSVSYTKLRSGAEAQAVTVKQVKRSLSRGWTFHFYWKIACTQVPNKSELAKKKHSKTFNLVYRLRENKCSNQIKMCFSLPSESCTRPVM